MNAFVFWWKTSLRKQVVYGTDGKPADCKGLRFKGKKPFEADTEYFITSEYSGWEYLGNGVYTKPRTTIADVRNPYWVDKLTKKLKWVRRNDVKN